MHRSAVALVLLLRFVRALVVSALQTLAVILKASRSSEASASAFVRVGFAPLSETGVAVLGSMVSLTPGTTTLDIDLAQRELLLHVLDANDIDAVVTVIRRDFEPGLRVLFGREEGV